MGSVTHVQLKKEKKLVRLKKEKKVTDEHRERLSKAAKKRHIPCSDEKKTYIIKKFIPIRKKVYCIETDTIYESVQECARQLNLYATNITKVCKGIHQTTGGYHLQYYK